MAIRFVSTRAHTVGITWLHMYIQVQKAGTGIQIKGEGVCGIASPRLLNSKK